MEKGGHPQQPSPNCMQRDFLDFLDFLYFLELLDFLDFLDFIIRPHKQRATLATTARTPAMAYNEGLHKISSIGPHPITT